MAKKKNSGNRMEISAAVQYIARAAFYMAVSFFFLALAALLFLSPSAVSRGLYYVVLVLNGLVAIGAVLLRRFMERSDEKLARERKAADPRPSISDWLTGQEKKTKENANTDTKSND